VLEKVAKGSQPIRAAAIRWRVVADRLLAAADFVEVAIAICEVSRDQFLIEECEVTLNTQDGRRGVCVDNFCGVSDEDRLARISEMRGTDPSVRLLREHHAPITCADDERTLLLPLLQMGGLVGTIRYRQELSPEQLRDLITLGTYASVRLAQLGTTSTDLVSRLRLLTPRQREVARYVSYGRTNAEVAMMLGMSENTVKKHLKEVFVVLETTNRTELAALLRDLPPEGPAPLGVTRVRDVAIARRH
jgi:DNA-binding CsgD family transcriptional regulator